VSERGDALEFVDKKVTSLGGQSGCLVPGATSGRTLHFASDQIKEHKEMFCAVARTTTTVLRIAYAKMMRDGDFMMEAGKEERDRQTHPPEEQALLSVGFTDTDYASNFFVFLKRNEYLRNFNPNAWRESCCGPDLQITSSTCRGRNNTCKFEDSQHLIEQTSGCERKLAKQSCWCLSFQFHLEHELKATWGLTIQKIETEMTQQVDVQIFRTMTTIEDVTRDQLAALEEAIKDWYRKRL